MIREVAGNGIKVMNNYVNTNDSKKSSFLNSFGKKCSKPILAIGVISFTAVALCDAVSSFVGGLKEPVRNNIRPQRR